MKKYGNVIFLGIIVLCFLILSPQVAQVMQGDVQNTGGGKKTIVIDPGHGGADPGKVGINDVLEKDINLSIALKLKALLEEQNYNVIMTRTEDVGLYSSTDRNKKSTDMKNRVTMINESDAVVAVSIHQNSFQQESSKGAQVFYHKLSPQGKLLADTLQCEIKEYIKDGNHRVAKENDSYYMLKNTKCPLVIVECGFLSNRQEANLLVQEEYQDKMAHAIEQGILKYMNQNEG